MDYKKAIARLIKREGLLEDRLQKIVDGGKGSERKVRNSLESVRTEKREVISSAAEADMERDDRKSKALRGRRGGGGRAAGIGSALGRTPKSLLRNKLMPTT